MNSFDVGATTLLLKTVPLHSWKVWVIYPNGQVERYQNRVPRKRKKRAQRMMRVIQ